MSSRLVEIAQRIAGEQHGVVSRAQLRRAGVPSSTIQSRVDGAFLFPVFRGVYLVGRSGLSLDGLRLAAVLAAGRGAVVGGRAAAMIWGFMDHFSPVDVFRLVGGANRRAQVRVDGSKVWPYLMIWRPVRLSDSDIRSVRGIPVTSVARTLWDLAALTSTQKFNRAFNEADRLRLIDDDEMSAFAAGMRGHHGAGLFRKRALARIPDIGRARSALEAIYLELLDRKVVPAADLNARVLDMEVDLVWWERRVIVELDGYEFHRGREAFERDAARGNRLKADGWSVLRVTWRMLNEDPDEVADLIVGVLERQPIGVLSSISTEPRLVAVSEPRGPVGTRC
ncbi:MAG TPA: DUF559 domain-containing protein [Solirubrobacterales bacterium]|nr:DUF559 domain-containing protein [Solirubrobacterales bacterium]